MESLEGKKVLLTGGTRGIGFATAKQFLQAGAQVLITGRDEKVFAAAEKLGDGAKGMVWNLREIDNFPAKGHEAIDLLGGLDILINNAGVTHAAETNNYTFQNSTLADWEAVMDTNLRAVFFLCQYFSDYMIKHQVKGHIFNVCSNMGYRMVSSAPYGISKWAIRGFSLGLGRELARQGIIVNTVSPGPVTTEMMNWHEGMENSFPHIPTGRYSTPEEIAEIILFLAQSRTIVGEGILADGGERLY